MGTELTTRTADLQAVLSSTDCVALRRISLGTVNHPGQPTRRYLAGGLKLTDEQRGKIGAKIRELEQFTKVVPSREVREASLGLIAKMLMAYPMAGSSAEAGSARGEAYLVALDDVPPWAISEAIKRWHKGQCGPDHNYRFAPAPAELREVAMKLIEPAAQTIYHLNLVLNALTIEEAMDPTAIDLVPGLKAPRLRVVP